MTGSIKYFNTVKVVSTLATIGILSACATPGNNGVSRSDWGHSNKFPDNIEYSIF